MEFTLLEPELLSSGPVVQRRFQARNVLGAALISSDRASWVQAATRLKLAAIPYDTTARMSGA